MVPVSLKLANFTSYGNSCPTLDFSKFHMAAISGQNGAGKSSLLDSITWCLWGSSRLGDSADQLVQLGKTEMEVEFSFELDNHTYTVKRKRNIKSGGSTSLEFFSGGASSPHTHNLTEGTIKSTQQKIIETLHLTFETFVNSAFIRQGHADEFTTKGATERKKILADILGLSNYDRLEEKAKERARESLTKLQLLEYQLLEIEAELSQKDERQKAVDEAQKEAEEAEKQLKEIESLIKTIGSEREIINLKQKGLEEKAERIKKALQELEDLKVQISLKEQSQKEHQTILDQKQEIEKNCLKLSGLQEKKKDLEIKRSELIKVKDEFGLIQKTIIQLEERRNNKITELEVLIKQLQTENKNLQDQNDHLLSHKDTCPTCKQTIGEDKNKEIVLENQTKIEKNNQELVLQNEKLSKCKSFILPEQTKANEKEVQVKKLEEETSEFNQLNSEINQLSIYENLNLKLQQAQTAIKTQQESISDLQKIYQTKEDQVKAESVQIKELDTLNSQLLEIKQRLQAQETVKEALSQKALQKRGQVGAAKQLLSRSEQLEKVMLEKSAEKANLKRDKDAFEELSLAFGKKGIQAMIIETATPEIEDEANRLLDRLTEGRMRVKFDTQKSTKAGTTVETLDIIISDEMGERAYEAYSGGEQFRVNFAIRLALSKLLTHRAGSKLQFLVIDEGFGTQDAQGRSRIVEALDIIKNDYQKILVITHLEELKEEFPVRIEVTKGSEGSTFEVIGG